MWKNYFLSAWQNLRRQKLFTCINVLGLAIGLSVFTLIFLYVENEYSWDGNWENSDRLHWVTYEFQINENNSFINPVGPFPVMGMLRDNFPEAIDKSAQIVSLGNYIQAGDNRFQGSVQMADASLLDILDLDVVSGSLQEVFAVPGRVALKEENAKNYFGSEDPIGKIITLEVTSRGSGLILNPDDIPDVQEFDYQVAAVYRMPEESSLNLFNLTLLEQGAIPGMNGSVQDWQGATQAMNLFLLQPNADIDSMNARIPGLVDAVMPREPWRVLSDDQKISDFHAFKFQSLQDAHFDEGLSLGNGGNKTSVVVFGLIGLLVLGMGSVNFVILATAKADDRKREVGVRKVLGARKSQLVYQFLGESVLHTLAALVLAMVLVFVALPVFANLIDQELSMALLDGWMVFRLILLAIVIGILGGIYPALVISELTLVSVFKAGQRAFFKRAVNIRNTLACLQFTIAIALIIATGVLYSQIAFVRNIEPGYRIQNLYTVFTNPQDRSLLAPLVNELGKLPGVEKIARSSRRPGPEGMGIITFGNYKNTLTNADVNWEGIFIDYDFFDVYEIPFIAGRSYVPELDIIPDRFAAPQSEESDEPRPPLKIVINRQLASSLGFTPAESAAGQLVSNVFTGPDGQEQSRPVEIIGVVENTRFKSLREAVGNEGYFLSDSNLPIITLAYSNAYQNNISAEVEAVWKNLGDDSFFRTAFVAEALLDEFQQEANEGRLLLTFSGLAIFIACMGLYGLASYTVKKGIKEVGVRKVLGAKFSTIILLYAWRFSKPVLIANFIAWPLAMYVMLRWLQSFSDQIGYDILIPICLIASVLALCIAWITVGITAAKAARANPVESLRYE